MKASALAIHTQLMAKSIGLSLRWKNFWESKTTISPLWQKHRHPNPNICVVDDLAKCKGFGHLQPHGEVLGFFAPLIPKEKVIEDVNVLYDHIV